MSHEFAAMNMAVENQSESDESNETKAEWSRRKITISMLLAMACIVAVAWGYNHRSADMHLESKVHITEKVSLAEAHRGYTNGGYGGFGRGFGASGDAADNEGKQDEDRAIRGGIVIEDGIAGNDGVSLHRGYSTR